MSRFWEFINVQATAGGRPCLPLTHVTDGYHFRDIRNLGKLSPRDCDVYKGERLLYFFYGRPSYRPHTSKTTVDVWSLLPICIILKQSVGDQAARVMPFDSGAFHRKMMHPPMHEDMKLEDFELNISPDVPAKIITIFYGNEHKYFHAKKDHREQLNYNKIDDLEIDSYFKLVRHRPNRDYDDRVTAIEYQLRNPVNLFKNTEAIILPKPFFDYSNVINQIESWGAIAIPYHVKEEFIPSELQGAIFDRLTSYLVDMGYLHI